MAEDERGLGADDGEQRPVPVGLGQPGEPLVQRVARVGHLGDHPAGLGLRRGVFDGAERAPRAQQVERLTGTASERTVREGFEHRGLRRDQAVAAGGGQHDEVDVQLGEVEGDVGAVAQVGRALGESDVDSGGDVRDVPERPRQLVPIGGIADDGLRQVRVPEHDEPLHAPVLEEVPRDGGAQITGRAGEQHGPLGLPGVRRDRGGAGS